MTSPRTLSDRPSLSLFQQPWWLEATAPGAWGEVVVDEAGEVVARLPFVMKRRQGLQILTMPKLTQTLGPWLAGDVISGSERLSLEKRLFGQLIDALPQYDLFSQCLHTSITNWQPFYWKGFQQTTLYTYIIDDLTDLDRVYLHFDASKKKNIKRSSRAVEVRQGLDVDAFYDHLTASLADRGETPSYSRSYFRSIHDASVGRVKGRTFYAIDTNGNIQSCIFIVWDSDSAYYLISSIDPKWRESGSNSLLIWEAIKFSATRTRRFNFEGSMIEGVEQSFRRFGGTQTAYMQVMRSSRRAKVLLSGLDLIRAAVGRPGR